VTKPAVFLDRDGVINVEKGYIHEVNDLDLIDGVARAIRKLNDLDIFVCAVSNQSGAARNYYDQNHIEALNQRVGNLLKVEAGAYLNAFYYCPYLSPSAGGTNPDLTGWSTSRKPNTGMLVAAAWEYDLDLSSSFMVGDKATDVDLAHNGGLQGILVKTGYGKKVLAGEYQHTIKADYVAEDLPNAVDWIIGQIASRA
jgi:D-glycero-D-manno-heptose 1,7-bisphosphate phosphatase